MGSTRSIKRKRSINVYCFAPVCLPGLQASAPLQILSNCTDYAAHTPVYTNLLRNCIVVKYFVFSTCRLQDDVPSSCMIEACLYKPLRPHMMFSPPVFRLRTSVVPASASVGYAEAKTCSTDTTESVAASRPACATENDRGVQ